MTDRHIMTQRITELLDERHAGLGDIFATEIQTKSTYDKDNRGRFRIDAIAIRKSFTKPCISVYEVKSSRADFEGDNKWKNYLQYGNKFFFVAPKGVISKNELPHSVGLIEYNTETDKIRQTKPAVFKECVLDFTIMMTLLNRGGDEQRTIRSLKRQLSNITKLVSKLKVQYPRRVIETEQKIAHIIGKLSTNKPLKSRHLKYTELNKKITSLFRILNNKSASVEFENGWVKCIAEMQTLLELDTSRDIKLGIGEINEIE